jgi:preprotein translocase SecE subunit
VAKADKSAGKKAKSTVRERASQSEDVKQPRRLRRTATSVAKPLKAAKRVGGKEYYLPMPKNRVGRFLNKRRSWVPKYFRNSWQELKQVTWPGRKETWQLTFAVFIFAIIFSIMIAITDYGLDKLFRKVLLK